jgi:hypothetical protein
MAWLLLTRNEGHPVWTHPSGHHIGDDSGIKVKTPNRSELGRVCGAGKENVFGDGVNDSGDSSLAIRYQNHSLCRLQNAVNRGLDRARALRRLFGKQIFLPLSDDFS